jgi:hypothetical protein
VGGGGRAAAAASVPVRQAKLRMPANSPLMFDLDALSRDLQRISPDELLDAGLPVTLARIYLAELAGRLGGRGERASAARCRWLAG